MTLKWLPLLIAPALLAIACGGGAEEAQPTPSSSPAVPLPSSTPAATPTPEPTVETLAFIDDGDLWLVNADGGNRRRITQFGGSDREAISFEWLPSGQEIAYWVSLPSDPGLPRFTSMLVNVEGRVLWERELRPTAFRFGIPAGVFWSPDGQLVAVFDETGVSIEDRDGQSVWTGTAGTEFSNPSSSSASWSARGSHFAFAEESEIVVVSRDGASVSRLDAGRAWEERSMYPCARSRLVLRSLVFTPDGEEVLAAVNCLDFAGTGGWPGWIIYEVSLDGHTSLLDSPIDDLAAFLFSPDGREIAVTSSGVATYCPTRADNVGRTTLYVLDPADGSASQLIPRAIAQLVEDLATEGRFPDIQISSRFHESPAIWSPASDAIVASSNATECVCRTLEECPALEQCLAEAEYPAECAAVAEESHRLLTEGVYLLRVDGVADEKIADEFAEGVSWSPSGHLLAYATGGHFVSRASGEPGSAQIRVFNLVTREVTDLGPGEAPAWRPLPPEAVTLAWAGEVIDNLRIRSEPTTDSDIVATLEKDSKVRIYGERESEEAEAGSGNRTWYRVIGGWVYSGSVKRTLTSIPTPNSRQLSCRPTRPGSGPNCRLAWRASSAPWLRPIHGPGSLAQGG